MEIVLRVFQVFLAVGLIGVVLLQRSEGGGLGMGSDGGMGSFMSVRGTANFLTRTTAILAFLFMTTCLALALISRPSATQQKSIFDSPGQTQRVPAAPLPAAPPAGETSPSETLPPAAPSANEKPLSSPLTTAPAQSSAPPSAPASAPAATGQKAPQPGPAQTPKQ